MTRTPQPPPSPRDQPPADSAGRGAPKVGPFTDFGQFGYGMIDRRCMWQDRYWVDISGAPHRLGDMSPNYVTNVIGYLRANANRWYLAELWWSALEALAFAREDPSRARRAITEARALLANDPTDWMATCPLMRRLHQLLADHAGPPEAETP